MVSDIQILAHIQEKIKEDKQGTASRMLLETIFMNPHLFGYHDFDEDNKAEFLLSLHDVIPKIIASYSEKRAQFTPYIITVIRLYSKSWRRHIVKNRIKTDSLHYCYKMEFDTAERVLDSPVANTRQNHCFSPVSFMEEPPEAATAVTKTADLTMLEKRAQNHARELILILTLKSAFYVSDKQTKLIARELDIDAELLRGMVETVRHNMEKKNKQVAHAIESRNCSYFLKMRYEFELENLEKGSDKYLALRRQLNFQNKILAQKNLILKNRHKDTLTASNALIGKIIHMRARRVCYLLSLLKLNDR